MIFAGLETLPDIPIFLGGPVNSNRLFFIHTLDTEVITGAMQLSEHLYFDGEFEILKKYITNGLPVEKHVKFFLGYSGWTPGQLKAEIENNSWLVSKSVTTENILHANDEMFWKESLENLGSKYKTWTQFPKNPDLN